MSSCTFFGHRDTPSNISADLYRFLEVLIQQKHIHTFYVGTQGNFDRTVQRILKELLLHYPELSCNIVLCYLPIQKGEPNFCLPTIFPEGLENVPPRFAIAQRNRWMVLHSDIVVTYITHSWGGAAQFAALAKKKNKSVYNLADPQSMSNP